MAKPKTQAKFFMKELRPLLGFTIEGVTWDDSNDDGFYGLKLKNREEAHKVLWFLGNDAGQPGKLEITDA